MTDPALDQDEFLGRGIFQLIHGGDRDEPEVIRLRQIGRIEEARSFIRYGEFTRGAALLQEVVEGTLPPDGADATDPEARDLVAVAHSVFGQGLESWGQDDEAVTEFALALELFSESHPGFRTAESLSDTVGSRVVCDVAMALSGAGEHEPAERLMRESRRHGPVTPEATRRLATYAAKAGRAQEAVALVDEALTVLPADPECWYALAHVRRAGLTTSTDRHAGPGDADAGLVAAYLRAARGCLANGAHARSLEALLALRELRPERVDVAVALVEVLRRLQRVPEALEVADAAVVLDPRSAEARMARALVLWDQERFEDSSDEAAQAAALDDEYGAARALLAILDMENGNLEASERWARESLRIAPENRPAMLVLVWILAMSTSERGAEADKELDVALALWPDDGRLLYMRCKVALDRDDAVTVAEMLERLMGADGLDEERAALLVRAYLFLGRFEDATSLLDQLRDHWPDNDAFPQLYATARIQSALSVDDDDASLVLAVEEASSVAPESPDVAYGKAMLMLRSWTPESLEAAGAELETSLANDGDHLESIVLLITILRELGRPEDALSWVARAADAGIDRVQHAMLRAECLRDLGGLDEAIATLTGVVADEGTNALDLIELRAELLGDAARWKEALKDRKDLVRLEPESADRHFDLAEVYRLAGDVAKAWDETRRALELDPDHFGARATRAALLSDEGNVKEARAEFDAILEAEPEFAFALRYSIQLAPTIEEATTFAGRLGPITNRLDADTELAYVCLRLGLPDRALEIVNAHLPQEPENVSLLVCAAYATAALSRYQESVDHARAAVQVDPDNARAVQALGEAELAAGHLSEAVANLGDAHSLLGGEVDVASRYADALAANDRPRQALDVLDGAVTGRPESAVAWRALGGTLVTLGYHSEAITCLERARELGDVDAWTLSAIGWCRLHLSPVDAAGALALFEQAAQLSEPDPWVIKDLANARHAIEPGSGDEDYERLIMQVARRGRSDPQLDALCGWAHFRMRRLARAGRLMVGATTEPRSAVFARFDLGLVGLCAGRFDQAQRHYESALELQREQAPLRRLGPLRVALVDLDAACIDWPEIADTKATHLVREQLAQRLADAPRLPPLAALAALAET